ncbi:hypothetical protein [Neolewinella sp.]|uniref:hypothetical protein n=1 Tax=Neolewinella sp. TaxID=2993543 RepID=UPI003B529DB8
MSTTYLISLLLLFVLGCSSPGLQPAPSADAAAETVTTQPFVFGSRGGHGAETYFLVKDGTLYRSAYADLRTNEEGYNFNYDDPAGDASNWERVGPAPDEASDLAADFPQAAFTSLTDTENCAALAYDGSCPYLGVGEGTNYRAYFGDFENSPQVAAYMERVATLVGRMLQ